MSGNSSHFQAAAVHAQNWGWQYAGRNASALTDVSFHVEPGERVLVLGASGSGKSTLLSAIAGLLDKDQGHASGTLLVNNRAPQEMRGEIGLVLQDPENQVILERIGDDVAFGCENMRVAPDQIWPRVKHALDLVGLDYPLDHPTSALSGGQKQRLALAGVLAMEPGLLLLDEPTANLDSDGSEKLIQALWALVEEKAPTMLIIEHKVEQWWEFITRIIIIGEEKLLWDGAPADLDAPTRTTVTTAGVWLPGTLDKFTVAPPRHIKGSVLTTTDLQAGHPSSGVMTEPMNVIFHSGSIHALTGANGSGKTATALTLGGLISPRAGVVQASEALVNMGKPVPKSTHPDKWSSRQLVRRIGSVFQAPEHQFVAGSVRDELRVGPRAMGKSLREQDQIVEELIENLKLGPLADVHPFTLSGGQKRRLSVATALATQPEVLILDEPTFGQDVTSWVSLIELLVSLRDKGSAIAAVTHDENFITRVADKRTHIGRAR